MGKQSYLSKYRTELMGISALGVLMTHAPYMDPCPGWLQRVFSYGGAAVYIFMFLSGIGLYFSVSSQDDSSFSLTDFYRRRLTRVMLPYLLIGGIWYGITCLLLERNFWMFLYELSTISFWIEHGSAWFVAALLPIYLVYPFYFRWIESGRRGCRTVAVLVCVLAGTSAIYMLAPEELYDNLSLVLNSLWVFVIGHYYGKKVKAGSNLAEFLVYFVIFFLTVKLVPALEICLPSQLMLYAAEGLLVMVVAALVLGYLQCGILDRVLRWFGKRSLELYLTNLFLIRAESYFGFADQVAGVRAYVQYGIILLLGIALSAVFHPLNNRISKVVLNRS